MLVLYDALQLNVSLFSVRVSASILKISIYRIEQVYIFIDSAYLRVRSAPSQKNKHMLTCLSIHLTVCRFFSLWTLWSWSLLGTPGAFSGIRESCTLHRTKQINNSLQGALLVALLKHMCCDKDNSPKVQHARWLQICGYQQAISN